MPNQSQLNLIALAIVSLATAIVILWQYRVTVREINALYNEGSFITSINIAEIRSRQK